MADGTCNFTYGLPIGYSKYVVHTEEKDRFNYITSGRRFNYFETIIFTLSKVLSLSPLISYKPTSCNSILSVCIYYIGHNREQTS